MKGMKKILQKGAPRGDYEIFFYEFHACYSVDILIIKNLTFAQQEAYHNALRYFLRDFLARIFL